MTILREEGPAALYKGFVPKVLRLAPGGGVLLLVVEFTLGVFRKGESTAAIPIGINADIVSASPWTSVPLTGWPRAT